VGSAARGTSTTSSPRSRPWVARLPQALGQLRAFLDVECDHGRIGVVDGEFAGDPIAAVSACAHWLTLATDAAQNARHALDQAHATLTWAAARVLD